MYLATLNLGLTAYLCVYQERAFFFSWSLLRVSSSPLEFSLLFDAYRCLFRARVLLIAARVFLFSLSYRQSDPFLLRFHLLVLSFIISIQLLIFRPNLIRLLLG